MLYTNNYVLVESLAVVQRRLGLQKVRALQSMVLPLLEIIWVDEDLHNAAMTRLLAANRRGLSLVDCTAFETMRRLGIETAFAFDHHFREQGFTLIP